jgi:signal transduction histidine kinase
MPALPGPRRPTPAATAIVAIAGIALTVVAVAFVAASHEGEQTSASALLEALIVGVPLATGLYALRTPRMLRLGMLLVATAAVWSLTALGESSGSLTYSIGRVAAWFLFPPLFYLMLAFPDGRVERRLERALLAAITALVLVLYVGSALLVEAYPAYTPWATCVGDCPANAFLAVDAQPAWVDGILIPVRETLAGLLLITVAVVLVVRWRRARALRRRTLAPLVVTGAYSALSLVAYYVVRRADPDGDAARVAGELWALSVPAVAAGLLAGLLRRRASVGDVLARLSLALAAPVDTLRLRDTLAAELADPAIEVLIPDAVPARWRDSAGNVATRSAAIATGLAATPLPDGDGVVLVHDPALRDDDELFEAVGALVVATVKHERTVARLATLLTELDESRKRIARIADLERSRIERDLHDGAQQRLIALRIKVSLAEEIARADPVRGVRSLRELGDDVELALDDVRSLAHGVYPSLLTDRGLVDALSNAVGESPLPVHFTTHRVTRQAPAVETAIYFTCLEALQNATKHAGTGTGVWLSLRQDDATFGFEVRDHGRGFEPPSGAFNGGLRNMKDRIEAIGGRVTIDSAPGQGTRIRGTIPLDGVSLSRP